MVLLNIQEKNFCKHWLQTTDVVHGIALLLEPTPEFYQRKSEKAPGVSWDFLLRYLKEYKRYFISSAYPSGELPVGYRDVFLY